MPKCSTIWREAQPENDNDILTMMAELSPINYAYFIRERNRRLLKALEEEDYC